MPKTNTTNKTWYSMNAKKHHAEIYIYEEIGFWGITAGDFAKELVALGDLETITLHLNTPGGSVADGTAIYNSIKKNSATVTVEIDGYALSMGSIIALAGDTIKMADNALFMIHNPWGWAMGDSEDMRKAAEVNDHHKEAMLNTYESKTGLDRDELSKMMDDETWFNADEALESGFIDEVTESVELAASANTHEFLNKLNLKNMPNDFFNTFDDPKNHLNNQFLATFKKFLLNSNKPQEKKEQPMNMKKFKALFAAKKDAETAYKKALADNPDLEKQLTNDEVDVNLSSVVADLGKNTDEIDALKQTVEKLSAEVEEAKTSHDKLVEALKTTVEDFQRDEADGGAIELNTKDIY